MDVAWDIERLSLCERLEVHPIVERPHHLLFARDFDNVRLLSVVAVTEVIHKYRLLPKSQINRGCAPRVGNVVATNSKNDSKAEVDFMAEG